MAKNVEKAPKPDLRVESATVVYEVREYNAAGKPIGRATLKPIELFRESAPDIWVVGDEVVKKITETPQTGQ